MPEHLNHSKTHLPPDLSAMVDAASESRTYKKGEVLYRSGDEPQCLFLLKKGLVGLALMSDAGREHLVRLFVASDFMSHRSLLAGEKYHASATALESSEVQALKKEIFFEWMQKHPSFHQFFLRRLAIDLGECERRHMRLVEQDASSRVAGALIYLKEMDPVHIWTRKEIADFAGTTTETVIRTLGRFEEGALIQQKGRPIEILNRQALIQMARFDG